MWKYITEVFNTFIAAVFNSKITFYWGSALWVTFNHLTAVLANLGGPKVTGSCPVWCPSTKRAGRMGLGTSDLSAWPQCQGWLWSSNSTHLEMAINFCAIMWHVQNKQVMRASQQRFRKVTSCFTNLIVFCNRVKWRRECGCFSLGVSKGFDTVWILLEKLSAHGLDRCTVFWVENWLDGQDMVMDGGKSSW